MSISATNEHSATKFEVEIKDGITVVTIAPVIDNPLSEDQEDELNKLEEMFSFRYTDRDDEYVANEVVLKEDITNPPIIESYRPFWNQQNNERRGIKRGWSDNRTDNNYRQPYHSYGNKRLQNNHSYDYNKR